MRARRQEQREPWWRQGLAVGVFLLTVLALAAMARVRGPSWVVAPLGLCFIGCMLYRRLRPRLFAGVEALLVVGYFVLVAVLRPYLDPGGQAPTALDGLSIVGLVILYPAQMALWTGRRTVQELVLLGLVAVSQFLYGMTLARPSSWTLGVAFCPVLVFTLLEYAVAREVEAVGSRPSRPRGHGLRLAGLAVILVPIMGILGGGVFYLLPRYSTITQAFDLLGESARPGPESAEDPETRGAGPRGLRTGPSRAMDLTVQGPIQLDPTELLSVRIRLEAHDRELPPEYGGRLYLRSRVLDDCLERGWAPSGSHYPRVHRPDARGRIDLPGPPPRPKCGFHVEVHPLHRESREGVVSLGRPVQVTVNRVLRGHPEEELVFQRRLVGRRGFKVDGEMIYAWEQVKRLVRRHGLRAVHAEQDHYTAVPERPRREKVAALARRIVERARDDGEKLDAILGYLGRPQFRYGLNLPPVRFPANPTEDFLFRSRVGHCERFADGLAVLCRHAGLPARVVKGFMGGEWRERPSPPGFRFRAQDAHAWVEVHFERLGWVAVDPSPGGNLANLGLTPPFGGLPPEAEAPEIALAPETFTGAEQLSLYQHLLERARAFVVALGWPLLLLGAAALIALVYFGRRVFAAAPVADEGRIEPGRPPAFNPILEFVRALRRRGLFLRRGETPLEFAVRAETVVDTPLVPVMQRLYAVRYGGLAFSDAERSEFEGWLERVARRAETDPALRGSSA